MATPGRNRFGQFIKRARGAIRSAGGKLRTAYRSPRGLAVRASARKKITGALNDPYRMGIVPKTLWTAWGANQLVAPLVGSPKLGYVGAIGEYENRRGQGWSGMRSVAAGWERYYELLMMRGSGYNPIYGKVLGTVADWATWKEAIGPITATVIDWGVSRVAGTAGRSIKTGPIQWVGSK